MGPVPVFGWVLIGMAAWVAVSVVVAVVVGRMVRARDAQVPRDAPRPARASGSLLGDPADDAPVGDAPADAQGGEAHRSDRG
ncbi:hypothetical protein ACFQ34_23290 [Pseudonocardia benzenivorans]|uniref:Uncharacterized protein n=1 Tax=Pseudonocardia benzenivorans TaxID=228005 RepID=A0ABW3VNH2_9PSEU|nr:hypothetical protein PSD17_42920 [Pseudonocardia sp. D17]